MAAFGARPFGPPAARLRPGILALTLLFAGVLLAAAADRAWGQSSQLVPLVTDQTPLALSTTFGTPSTGRVNEAGDYAIIGPQGTAVFVRRAGTARFVRILQAGDELPRFPGSRVLSTLTVSGALFVAPSGLIAFSMGVSSPTGQINGAVLTYDGTLRSVVLGTDTAPGTGGARFERNLVLSAVNDLGEMVVSSDLVPDRSPVTARPTVFFVPVGGGPVRIAGMGDVAPGTGSTFAAVGAGLLNNRSEVVFTASIAGGGTGLGIFKWTAATGVTKIVAPGDLLPGDVGFTNAVATRLNNVGEILFSAQAALWISSPATGVTRLMGFGDAVPSVGGTFGTPTIAAFNDNGDAAFQSVVNGGSSSFGVFRMHAGSLAQMIALRGQVANGLALNTFTAFSMNNAGAVSFRAADTSGQPIGIFRQSDGNPLESIALESQATGTPLGGVIGLSSTNTTQILETGAVYFGADVPNGTAYRAEFLATPGAKNILMTTLDPLPAGGRPILGARSFGVGGAGDYVGFVAQLPGGAYSFALHQISAATTSIVATEGDSFAAGRLLFADPNSIFVAPTGEIIFRARIVGGPVNTRSAVLAGRFGLPVAKVVMDGDIDSAGRTLSGFTLNSLSPSPVNAFGQVAFGVNIVNGSTGGVFIGSAGTTPVKVAINGDSVSGFINGTVISGVGRAVGINSTGQVLFFSQTRSPLQAGQSNADQFHNGIYIGSGGGIATKIAHDRELAPGGVGDFAGFLEPAFNNAGEAAFVASLNNGTGGIFLYSPSSLPILTALARTGSPSPAGGTFVFNAPLRPDVIMNDNRDVVFLADLTGGPAESAYFIRRGAQGSLQVLVTTGQPAPGTNTVFAALPHTLNSHSGEFNQLSPFGNVSFLGRFIADGLLINSYWHVRPDNVVEDLLVRGIVAPEFGSGSAVLSSQVSSWAGRQFPIFARIAGGTFTDGIFLFVPGVAGASTPAGSGVAVQPSDSVTGGTPVSLTFDHVVQTGQTSVTSSAAGPAIPSAFALGNPPMFFNITTTAAFNGGVEVCVNYSGVNFPLDADVRLLHFENGAWVDVTTNGAAGAFICGVVTSLSPFAVVRRIDTTAPTLTVTLNPNVVWPPDGRMISVSATIQVSDDFDPSPRVELVSITSNEALAAGDIQDATSGTDDRQFRLRATRLATGKGRVYTVTYRAIDASGNVTTARAFVSVPHDLGRGGTR